MSMVISLITPVSFGIWKIPMRGQNFINAQYAQNQSLEISRVVQEGVLFNNFFELESVIENNLPAEPIIIFCSILQLSQISENRKKSFLEFFSKYNLHFSIELTSGKGKDFLKDILSQSSYYSQLKNINNNMESYTEFYNKYKNTTEYL